VPINSELTIKKVAIFSNAQTAEPNKQFKLFIKDLPPRAANPL
jgi:hypothetical protein